MKTKYQDSPLYKLLGYVKKRPGMYVGYEGLRGLDNLLVGWKLHRIEFPDGDAWADIFLTDFDEFVAAKYCSSSTRGSTSLIEIHVGEEESLDVFFDLLDEFVTSKQA